jgi:hypothetical protein
MPRAKLPDVLEFWGDPWTHTQGRRGWIGPAITDPEDPMLASAVEYQRIVRRGGHYVMLDPWITLNRFGWDEEDAEGMTLTTADGTVIPLGDTDDEEEEEP